MISIITVGMNHLAFLKSLLYSVFQMEQNVSFEMIYVDNCSTDGSVDYVRAKYPQIKILQNEKPLGFGENNNKGVLAASGKYVAIINPDIVLALNSLKELYDYAEAQQEWGILVPKLLNPDGSTQHSIRGYITPQILFNRFLTKGNDKAINNAVDKYLCKDLDPNKTQPVNWAIGAALFLRKDFYAHLGGFDQDYFLYMEDEDLCLRSWKNGMPVVYIPTSVMTHNHLRGSSKIGKKTFMHLKSMFIFFRKHGMRIKDYTKVNNF